MLFSDLDRRAVMFEGGTLNIAGPGGSPAPIPYPAASPTPKAGMRIRLGEGAPKKPVVFGPQSGGLPGRIVPSQPKIVIG